MTTVVRTVGAALVVLGVAAYVLTGADSITALLPAFLGAPIGLLGILAGRESLRRHAIHGALVLALLGLFGTLGNLVELPALLTGGDVERPVAVVASTVTALLCLGLLVLGIRSFAAARRSRTPTAG